MRATSWDIMKLAQKYEGEFDFTDFTPEEIDEILGLDEQGATIDEIRARYFEFYDDVKDRTLATHKWSD